MAGAKWLAVLAAALLFSGCVTRPADPRVAALAVDTTEDGYRWSFRLTSGETVTAAARTLEQALAARGLALDRVSQIGFSPSLAERGISPVMDQLLRQPNLPRGAAVLLAPDPSGSPQQPPAAGPRLHHLRTHLMGAGGDAVLPVAGAPAAAVLKGDRLAGVLSPAETATLALVRGAPGPFIAELPDPRAPDRTVVLRFHQPAPPRYQTGFYRGRPWIGVAVTLRAEILDAAPSNRSRLPGAAAGYWRKERIEPLLRKLYGGWEADPLDLAQRFRLRFATMDAWQAYRWRERIKHLQFQVHTDVQLLHGRIQTP